MAQIQDKQSQSEVYPIKLSPEAVDALRQIADLSGISKRYKDEPDKILVEAFRQALGTELFINRMLDEGWTVHLEKDHWLYRRDKEVVWPEFN